MSVVVLYVATAIIFLAIDVVALRFFLRRLFEVHVGDLLLEQPRYGAAAIFYLLYIAGIVWFASLSAFREDLPMRALLNGAVLGAMAYGTYEFTNYATLKSWSLNQVMVDTLWGMALTGVAAWGGVVVVRAFVA